MIATHITIKQHVYNPHASVYLRVLVKGSNLRIASPASN